MTAVHEQPSWEESAERLIVLVQAQQDALDDGDVERFASLVMERARVQDDLMAIASDISGPDDRRALGQLLGRVAAVDRASFVAASRLMSEVSAELARVRQGRAALHGYGQPGARALAATSLLDQVG